MTTAMTTPVAKPASTPIVASPSNAPPIAPAMVANAIGMPPARGEGEGALIASGSATIDASTLPSGAMPPV